MRKTKTIGHDDFLARRQFPDQIGVFSNMWISTPTIAPWKNGIGFSRRKTQLHDWPRGNVLVSPMASLFHEAGKIFGSPDAVHRVMSWFMAQSEFSLRHP